MKSALAIVALAGVVAAGEYPDMPKCSVSLTISFQAAQWQLMGSNVLVLTACSGNAWMSLFLRHLAEIIRTQPAIAGRMWRTRCLTLPGNA